MTKGMFILMSHIKGRLFCADTEKPEHCYTIKQEKLLPFTSRGAAGGGGPTPALCAHLPPHQGEAFCGHTLPGRDIKDKIHSLQLKQPFIWS